MLRREVEVWGRPASYLQVGQGEPILYIHGFPTAGYLWREVMMVTGHSHCAIACDLPGFGHSQLLDDTHTWHRLVEWVGAFIDALGHQTVHLAVHDWGGLIGLGWAAQNPLRVSSLFITDTSFRSRDRWHGLAQQWREPGVGEKLMGDLTEEGFAAMLRLAGPLPDDAVSEYFRCLKTTQHRMAKLEMYRSLDFEMLAPLEPLLPDVAPGRTKLVWGGTDPFVPVKTAFRLGTTLAADVTVLEGVGHFLQEERGSQIGAMHLELLKSQ